MADPNPLIECVPHKGSRHTFVSIATPSHVALALVAMRSITLAREPVNKIVFTLGLKPIHVAELPEGVTLLAIEDFLDAALLHTLISRYMPAEASCALKPMAMRILSCAGHRHIHYVDSDTRFYSDAAPVCDALEQADIMLVPHYTTGYPHDGRRPRELTLLRAGVFNAGYVGVRNDEPGRSFLDWWSERLKKYCYLAPSTGMSGDQRWLDLVPALYPNTKLLRHPGVNVGYWNLHERQITQGAEGVLVNQAPLVLYHFSGLDPANPRRLSIYQDRLTPEQTPIISSLLADYVAEVILMKRKLGTLPSYPHGKWWHGDHWLQRKYRKYCRHHSIQ